MSAGIEALTSAFPALYGSTVWLCLGTLAIITGLNLWGVSESAKVFTVPTVPTVAFIAAIAAVIIGGLIRGHPAVPLDHHLGSSAETVGILLVLKAFASGCSALTGVEAIANAVPEFRQPRARRAQHTEVWLGILLGGMLIGLGILIRKFSVLPHPKITVLAQLTEASLGHNFVYYAIQIITMVLLALAANTSFGGLPVLASLLAKDNFLPHMFGLRADRQVHRYGVVVLAVLAAALLVAANGNTQALVPLFAVGVFVGFTLSQLGMVRHWRAERTRGWMARATINGVGAVLTTVTVVFADPQDEAADVSFRQRWEEWHPNVPLITLRSVHRSIARPIVRYLCQLEDEDQYHRLVVLIPEVQPKKFWYYLLFNQRGVILDRAIRRGTGHVVLCRLRYRLVQIASGDAADAVPASAGVIPRRRLGNCGSVR